MQKNLVLRQIPVNKFAQKVFHLTLSSLSQSMLSGLRSLWAMQFVWRKSSAEVTSRMTRLASLSVNLSFCWMCLRRWPPNIRSNTRLNCLSSSKKSTRFRTFLRKWEKCVFINKMNHQQKYITYMTFYDKHEQDHSLYHSIYYSKNISYYFSFHCGKPEWCLFEQIHSLLH